jgi:ABC-type oligopeptide transport system ATPase subunit
VLDDHNAFIVGGGIKVLPSLINNYPHEFSGGSVSALALPGHHMHSPKFVVCDEPVSALDVSIQTLVINLLKKLKEEMGLT